MQIRFATDLSADEYVRRRAWQDARLGNCPLHGKGGCGFARHGTYSRQTPAGTKIARWYCPDGHSTFSLLPDCLSSRLPGSLIDVETAIDKVENAPSQEAAVFGLRIDVGLTGVLRWIRRRLFLIRTTLTLLIKLVPALLLFASGYTGTVDRPFCWPLKIIAQVFHHSCLLYIDFGGNLFSFSRWVSTRLVLEWRFFSFFPLRSGTEPYRRGQNIQIWPGRHPQCR